MTERKGILIVGDELLSVGLVVGLASKGFEVTVVCKSSTLLQSCQSAVNFVGVELAKNSECEEVLAKVMGTAELVVCLLAGEMQAEVLRICISSQKSLLTPFPLTTRSRMLEHDALEAGITILSEVGMSPGLDHVTTIAIVERTKDSGNHVLKMETYCGALPLPQFANNPFRFKFSRSAADVLSSVVKPARFISNDLVTSMKSEEVLRHTHPYQRSVPTSLPMEAYPNGDSTAMILQYGLHGVQTYARFVVRFEGFCLLMKGFAQVGLLDLGRKPAEETWIEVINDLMTGKESSTIPLPEWVPAEAEDAMKRALGLLTDSTLEEKLSILQALNYVGALAATPVGDHPSILHAFGALLERALRFRPEERDFVFIDHVVTYEAAGVVCEMRASLESEGTPVGSGSMVRLAGLHMVAAAQWMSMGRCAPGLMLPLPLDYVEFVLSELNLEGVSLVEKTLSQPSIA